MRMKDIHERIAYARKAAGLTQDAVADHFGIRRASVAQWEVKRTRPSIERINELARLLDTTPEWLIDGIGEPPAKRELQERVPEPIPADAEEEFLRRLRRADPKVRESILILLGFRSPRGE